jgi:sn-glycerol 3-phosphate transport system permease protein
MEKRAVFGNRALPYALLAPQIAITMIFFYWPAAQAVRQSFLVEDAFGLSTEFVWFENYAHLFSDPSYYRTLWTTIVFSTAVTVTSLSVALLLAVMADREIKAGTGYRTLLIWPYAVAPAVAGVLWIFMLDPSLGIVAQGLRSLGLDWNPRLNGNHAMIQVVLACSWKQISYNFLFFLAGLQAIPKSVIEAAAIDGARPWRRFWTIILPLLSPTTFFLVGREHRLRVLRDLRDDRHHDGRRSGQGHRDTRLQGLCGWTARGRPRRFGRAVGGPDGDRDRPYGHPVPLHRAQGHLLMVERRTAFSTLLPHLVLLAGVASRRLSRSISRSSGRRMNRP